nr:immunoglobulin light chain junction region [Macaca mulatta]
GQHYYSTPYSF